MFLNGVILSCLKLRHRIAHGKVQLEGKHIFFRTERCVFIMKAQKCRQTLKIGIEKVFTENLLSTLCYNPKIII